MVKYIIIENDSITINRIRFILNEFLVFKCIGIAHNYESTMNLLLKEMPALVFVNIDNVLENPFQCIQEFNQFQECSTEYIAVSNFKENAYAAIKNEFLDLLLLPLSELDIRKSVLKFQKKTKIKRLSTICIKSYRDYQYLNTKEILFLKADNNATDFHMHNGPPISAFKTLKTYENILPYNFKRIHKSYIINSNHVSRINYGKLICFLKQCKEQIPFSKTYLEKVKRINNILNLSTIHSLN